MTPSTRYANVGDHLVAYQVFGKGPEAPALPFVMGIGSHVELIWEKSTFPALAARLCSFARVILFDRRGAGLSDRLRPPTPPRGRAGPRT